MHRIERTPVIPISDDPHFVDYCEMPSWDEKVTQTLRKDATERWQFRVALITFCVFLTLWLTRYWR